MDNNGKIYVTDYYNYRVQVFSSSGAYEYSIGSGDSGSGPSEFEEHYGIAVDSNGKIYVADAGNNRIQVFSNTGAYEFNITGSTQLGDFYYPYGVTVDNEGKIYVTDSSNDRIQVFSSSGGFLYGFGSSGSNEGQFDFPSDIAVDSDGIIYIADSSNHRIQVFSNSGTFLYSFGSNGSLIGQFNKPNFVAVDNKGKIYVSDEGNDRIQVFYAAKCFELASGNIGIGVNNPDEKLVVDGQIKILDGNQGTNKVLYSDENGASSWDYVKNTIETFVVDSGETISAGDILQFFDGKIQKGIGGDATAISFGSEYSYQNSIVNNVSVSSLNDTNIVVNYTDNNKVKVKVGVISGSTISWGNEYTGSSNNAEGSAIALSENCIVSGYIDFDQGKIFAKVGTISGTTISWGDAYSYNSGMMIMDPKLSSLSNNRFAVVFIDMGDSGKLKTIIGTVSGTTINWGSTYTFGDSFETYNMAALGENRLLYVYQGGSSHGFARIGAITGTAVDFGEETKFNAASTNNIAIGPVSDNSFIVAYSDDTSFGTAISGTVSGTSTVNFAQESIFKNSQASSMALSYLSGSNFVVTFSDFNNNGYGTAIIGTILGQTITWGEESVFSNKDETSTSVERLNDNTFVVTGKTAVIGNVSAPIPVGIALNSATGGNNVQVTFSGLVDSLSGLSTGSEYYADEAGNLTTTETDRYIGVALSETELMIQTDRPGASSYVKKTGDTMSGDLILQSNLILANSSQAVSQTVLKAMSQSESRTITFPDASGVVVLTDNGSVDIEPPDGSIGSEKIAENAIKYTHIAGIDTDYKGKVLTSDASGNTSWDYVKNEIESFTVYTNSSISAGDIVQFANGNILKGSGGLGIDPMFGNETTFNYTSTTYISIASLSESKFVVAYSDDGNNYTGVAVIGTISGTSVSWGNKYTFYNGQTSYISVSRLSENSFVIVYSDADDTYKGNAIIGTVSDTTISFGSKDIFYSSNCSSVSASGLNDTRFVVVFSDFVSGSIGLAKIGNVSNTTISWGSKYTFNNADTGYIDVSSLGDSKFVAAYMDDTNNDYGTAIVGTVSYSTISYGSEYTFNTVKTEEISISNLSDNTFVIGCRYNESSGRAIMGTVSGTTISWGNESIFNSGDTRDVSIYRLSDSRFVVGYTDAGNSNKGTAIVGTVSGTNTTGTISFGNETLINNLPASGVVLSRLTDSRFIVAYEEYIDGNTENGNVKIGYIPEYFPVGIALNSGTNGNTIQIAVSGVANGLTGLSSGTKYYADESGNLTSTVTERYIGVGLSETELLIQSDTPGSMTIPDNFITAPKLAGPNSAALTNGTFGQALISNGNGSFSWASGSPFESFAATGQVFSYTFGKPGIKDGELNLPTGIDIDSSGNIYICDSENHRVQVFSSSGAFQYSIGTGSSGDQAGQFDTPAMLCLDDNNKLYVTEKGNDRVQVFCLSENSAAYEYSFGTSGTGPGQFDDPTGIAIDSNGKIYVADYFNDRIQIFSSSGSFEYSIVSGMSGNSDLQIDRPTGLAFDSNGKLYITDNDASVQVLSSSLTFDYSIGTGIAGFGENELAQPYSVDFDSSGNIYITNIMNDTVKVYSSSGAYKFCFGSGGSNTGEFQAPMGLAIDMDNHIYVSDTYNNRIQVFNINNTHRIQTKNVAIGKTNTYEKFEVNGTVKINDALKLEPMSSAPQNPSAGWLYFDSTDNKLKVYDGTTWQDCF
ncbi:NHL repeat containing protein [Candidatus Magnetomorum sp. HK-1]|nr:NHL repeat containing protein [Candidatus Magnetomorum sp. HK-1]